MVTAQVRSIGVNQDLMLSALARNREWHHGCGWCLESNTATRRILDTLKKRGLVRSSVQKRRGSYVDVFSLVPVKETPLEAFHRIVESAPAWLPLVDDGHEDSLDGRRLVSGSIIELQATLAMSAITAHGSITDRRRYPWGVAVVYSIDVRRRRTLQGFVAGFTFRSTLLPEMRFRWPEKG